MLGDNNKRTVYTISSSKEVNIRILLELKNIGM